MDDSSDVYAVRGRMFRLAKGACPQRAMSCHLQSMCAIFVGQGYHCDADSIRRYNAGRCGVLLCLPSENALPVVVIARLILQFNHVSPLGDDRSYNVLVRPVAGGVRARSAMNLILARVSAVADEASKDPRYIVWPRHEFRVSP